MTSKLLLLTMLWLWLANGAAQAESCDPNAVDVATTAVPYQTPHGLAKARRLLAAPPAEAETILIGDSLAAFWPVEMAQRQFRSGSVWNFAVGGSLTQNTLWQIDALAPDRLRPERIVAIIGTNNLTFDYMPACAIAAGMQAVVEAAHRRWPDATVFVMGIAPRGEDYHFRDQARRAVNRAVGVWAADRDYVRFFEPDPDELTCSRYSRPVRQATTASKRRADCDNYADDFGHFRRPGYDVIHRAMMQ